jgi:capsular polysaccharide biosynthesis protein
VAQSPWTLIIILTVLLLIFLSFVLLIVRKYVSKVKRELTNNKSRQQNSIYTDVRNYSLRTMYDDCGLSFTDIDRINRLNVNNCQSSRHSEAEYLELNGETTEPVYTPILPPIQ